MSVAGKPVVSKGMPPVAAAALADLLGKLEPASPRYATDAVELVLSHARQVRASDVHFHPGQGGLEVRWRLDGVLHPVAILPAKLAPNIVARLKVLAELLSYRTDVPQEGRIRAAPGEVEMRISTFPTLHGERAVVRVFAAAGAFLRLDDLGLPSEIRDALSALLEETSGAVVLSGPAGSGKTTTIYACLRELAARSKGERSLATMEDPIESAVPGVAQAQVNLTAGLTLETGLKSLLRQDPEVLAIGEIRDRTTAELAFQAALTGHLTLTTFHAGSASEVVGRLLDMGLEPYAIRSGLLAVLSLRLARRLCPSCAAPASTPEQLLGLPVAQANVPVGCDFCGRTGYNGRIVLAELLMPRLGAIGPAILAKADVHELERLAREAGMVTRWQRAYQAVESGITSPAEIRRVLGVSTQTG